MAALDDLLRWEDAGGAWSLLDDDGAVLRIALLRCDGGEQVDELVSDDDALRRHVLGA
jgi:hypothetical protein